MRKAILFCSLALCLSGCAPSGNLEYRAREVRPFPDPSLATDNSESQIYKTQMLKAPPEEVPAATPQMPAPGAKKVVGQNTTAPKAAPPVTAVQQ